MKKQALSIAATLSFIVAFLAGPVSAQQWSLHAPEFGDHEYWWLLPSYWKTIQFADLNGDGRKEVCGRATGGIYCVLNYYNSFGPLTRWTESFSDARGWKLDPSSWATIRFPDVDGDGKADVCGRAADGIYCARSNGNSFNPLSKWDTSSTFSDVNWWNTDPAYWETIQFPDISGDGKADVCGRGYDPSSNQTGIVCSISTGTSFGSGRLYSDNFGDAYGWNTNRSYWASIRFPDVDGDKRADVCGRRAEGIWCAVNETGQAPGRFTAAKLWSSLYSDGNQWGGDESNWGTIHFADINGDGKADICGRAYYGLYCGTSAVSPSGTRHFTIPNQPDVPFFSNLNHWQSPHYYRTIRLVDVNGDGRADACGRASNGIHCALSRLNAPLFASAIHWLPEFGDNPYATYEVYWGTVQPADVDYRLSLNGAEWCGRGPSGVKCYVR
jgi:hypothetical protein